MIRASPLANLPPTTSASSWVINPDSYYAGVLAWVEKTYGPPKRLFYGMAGAAYYNAEKAPANVVANEKAIAKAVERLRKAGIIVSMFIDPDIQQIDVSQAIGATAVEIQTARYSEAKTPADRQRELDLLTEAADFARQQGLHVHMGHGLNYENVRAVARIPGLAELNIGHSIVSRAVLVGMERAVREMKDVLRGAGG